MVIKLDTSDHSIVVGCSEHPWFSELASSTAEAWRRAAAHEARSHESDDRNARRNAQQRARRHTGVKRAKH